MTKIGAIDDKTKNVTTPNNNNKDVAKTDKYAANTRLLTVFDVDDRKGYLSEKERAYYQEFLNSPDFYVNIYDENGNKIRYVEDLDAGNYLVYDFKDGKRITSTVFNAETGDEKRTEFIFDADGNEIGMRETNNRSKTQDVNVEYNENNKPVKIYCAIFPKICKSSANIIPLKIQVKIIKIRIPLTSFSAWVFFIKRIYINTITKITNII